MEQDDTPRPVKVKRDGPRGWHWVAAANYDPEKHELYEEPAQAPPPDPPAAPVAAPARQAPKGRTRRT